MKKKATYLVFCMIFVATRGYSQKKPIYSVPNITPIHFFKPSVAPQLFFNAPLFISPAADVQQVLAPNYYTTHFGFFCKQELQLEKAVKMPIKIRLGSVQEVDRMEGKRNAAPIP